MKKNIILLSSFSLAFLSMASSFDLEMTGPEYFNYMNSAEFKARETPPTSEEVDRVLEVGKRNLEWFKLINSQRPSDQQLALYTPELQSGIPIESPKAYNESTVLADYNNLMREAPESFKTVIQGSGQLPQVHPFATDEEYLTWTRKMDRVYQSNSRWKIMEPYLWSLESRSAKDVRGYYFLAKVEDLQDKLTRWGFLSGENQEQYSEWLVLQCHNSGLSKPQCRSQLTRAIQQNQVWQFHQQYVGNGKTTFDSYFNLRNARRDVVWNNDNPLLALIPFIKPQSLEVERWLVDNIEDEWKWNDWKLKLDFIRDGNNSTFIVFTPGATPNVNGLGGNQITMDANAPLQDYGSRWTIRHEYGHVLGLPDCYIEFYDADSKLIINYQIDLTNLMCSRKGKLQEKHYLELKKHYYSQR